MSSRKNENRPQTIEEFLQTPRWKNHLHALARMGIKNKLELRRFLEQSRPDDPMIKSILNDGLEPPDDEPSGPADLPSSQNNWFGNRMPDSPEVANIQKYIDEMGLAVEKES